MYLIVQTSIEPEQVVKEITRLYETNESCLGHFIIKTIQMFGVEVLEGQCFFDHFPVSFE